MNELAKVETGLTLQPKEITEQTVAIATHLGELAFKSGIFKAPSAAGAAMIMLKGYELGFPMTAAAEFITVIQNTVGLTPRGAMAIMQNHPEIIRSVSLEDLENDGKYLGCRCTIVRIRNGQDHKYTKTFTLADAEQAQLMKDDSGWEKYPKQMCQWRALGFAADIACPDLLAGLTGLMKMPEILPDADAAFSDTERNDQVIEVKPAEPEGPTLAEMIEKYGVEAIMAANNGIIPKTPAECAEVAEKIESGAA